MWWSEARRTFNKAVRTVIEAFSRTGLPRTACGFVLLACREWLERLYIGHPKRTHLVVEGERQCRQHLTCSYRLNEDIRLLTGMTERLSGSKR